MGYEDWSYAFATGQDYYGETVDPVLAQSNAIAFASLTDEPPSLEQAARDITEYCRFVPLCELYDYLSKIWNIPRPAAKLLAYRAMWSN